MDLIPIPQEVVLQINTTHKKVCALTEMRKKLQEQEVSRNNRVLKKTTLKMAEYIDTNLPLTELDELIDDMHRSTLLLQREKLKRQNKKNRV